MPANRHLLLDLPALKELSIRPAYKKQLKFDLLRTGVLRFLEQKIARGRSDLRIIFFGFQLDDADQLADFEYERCGCKACHSGNYEKLLAKNQSKLVESELKFIKKISYSMDNVDSIQNDSIPSDSIPGDSIPSDSIPSDFYRKLHHVEQVCVYERRATEYTSEKVDRLVDFLKCFKNLNSLIFKAPLVPNFFEKLVVAFPQLRSLVIEPYEQHDSRLREANEFEVVTLLTKFEHLYKSSLESPHSSWYLENRIGETFEHYVTINGYFYIVRKFQLFRRKRKVAIYELYVCSYRHEPGYKFFGNFDKLDDLNEALRENFDFEE